MGIYVFTTSIKFVTGLTKATINNANMLAEIDDVTIVTILGNEVANYTDMNIELNKNINVVSLQSLRNNIENEYELKLGKWVKFTKPQYPYNLSYNLHDRKIFQDIASSLKEDDNVVFASLFVSRLFQHAGAKFNCKTIGQIHCNIEEDKFNLENLKLSLEVLDDIQVLSTGSKKTLAKITGFDVNRIHNISNILIPSNNIEFENKTEFIYGVVGSFQERKNQKGLIPIVRKLKNKKIKIHCYGNPAGQYYDEFVKMIKDNKLEDRIIVKGLANEMDIYNNIDAMLCIPVSEGQSYVILESLAYSKPLISNDHKYGPEDMVLHDYNGFKVSGKNIFTNKKFANYMDALASDEQTYKKFAQNSKKLFDKQFSRDAIKEQFLLIFRSGNNKTKTITNIVKYDTCQLICDVEYNKEQIKLSNFNERNIEIFRIHNYDKFQLIGKSTEELTFERNSPGTVSFAMKKENKYKHLFSVGPIRGKECAYVNYLLIDYIVDATKLSGFASDQASNKNLFPYMYNKRVLEVRDMKGINVDFTITTNIFQQYYMPLIEVDTNIKEIAIIYKEEDENIIY